MKADADKPTACPEREVLLNALLDGELDAVNAARQEEHLRSCAGCAQAYRRLQALRQLMGEAELRHPAPASLRDGVEAILKGQAARSPSATPAPRGRPASWITGGAAGLLAASLAMVAVLPQISANRVDQELVSGHVRSLLANHLTDIPTSSQHVVRPWFNGKVDLAPPAPELAAQGFPLVGGRLDYIDGRVTPAIVYRRRLHTVNLFVMPAEGQPIKGVRTARRDGYNLVEWTSGGLRFAAVSDIELNDLKLFRQAFAANAAL